jgi:BRCA1 C Terminus (BRCT) domain
MKYKIHLSGFTQEEKSSYQGKIEALGGQFHPDLMTYTNILICESVKNVKYKQASLLGAKVMSRAWLDESIREGIFLPLSILKLPFFQGLKLGVIGYGGD